MTEPPKPGQLYLFYDDWDVHDPVRHIVMILGDVDDSCWRDEFECTAWSTRDPRIGDWYFPDEQHMTLLEDVL